MITIRHFKWGKHITVSDQGPPKNDEVAYAVGLIDPHFPPPSKRNCAVCGLPQSEHHYNGAAYGVCGKYVEPA